MLVVERTSIGLKLHNSSRGPVCVRVARVQGEDRCWFARPEQCETLHDGESADFAEPSTDHAGGCPSGALEFRVGRPLDDGTTWWTDSALAEFAANTKELEDGDLDNAPPWEDVVSPVDWHHTDRNRVETWRRHSSEYVDKAKTLEEARILAGDTTPIPTRKSFATQLQTLRKLEREKTWSDLAEAGAIGEPGEMPPMFVVDDRRGTVTMRNISEFQYSVKLKRSTNRIDPMRTYNPCMFNVEFMQVSAGNTIEFSGFPESCEAGPLRFKISSQGREQNIEWWSRAAIEEYKEEAAFSAQLNAREGHYPPVDEIAGQMRGFPAVLKDTGRAERWHREMDHFKEVRRAHN
jgi:hypothetical protein